VPFWRMPHRQHVVGKVGRLAPGGRERDVEAHQRLVGERLDPREPVGIGPDRVVHAREVDVELPASSFRKCGSRNDSSFIARGYSTGHVSSFHTCGWGGVWIGLGTNLFQALGYTLPGWATAPMSAFSRKSVRDTCQPPRLPAAALRQLCVDSCVPALATRSATAAMTSGSTPDSRAAYSNVNSRYMSRSACSKLSKTCGRIGAARP